MPKKKKEALPTYTVLIRTPAGTQTVIETNDVKKKRSGHTPSTREAAASASTAGSCGYSRRTGS